MVSLQIWLDKLPEDKVNYYNKTRMSIELFSQKLGLSYQIIIHDLQQYGYQYDRSQHLFRKISL